MTIHLETKFVAIVLCVVVLSLLHSADSRAQDKQDPTAQSDVIKQTISKIKEVEKLDTYIAKNAELTAINKQLQAQIAQH